MIKKNTTKKDDSPEIESKERSSLSNKKFGEPAMEGTPFPRSINSYQRSLGNIATLRWHQDANTVQPKLRAGSTSDPYEQEADRYVEQILSPDAEKPLLSPVPTTIQRAPAENASTSSTETPQTPPTTEETPAEETTPTPGLIVEDTATEPAPGQMKKSDFLSQLKASVCGTAEAALAGTIWSVMGCPWIVRWFDYYSGRSSQQIERAIQKYAPGAAGITSATDYIPIITSRVRSAIATWSETGEITGVPEGVPTGISGAGEESPSPEQGGVLFKGQEGRSTKAANPQHIQTQLGPGSPLDSGVRSRMESAFSQNFSNVRIHTDTKGAQISDNLNARAFTIGSNIAFGRGEYQPGTLIGDALIAHELAHTIQQGGGRSGTVPMHKGEASHSSLEEDADTSAVGAVASLWSGMKGGLSHISRNTMPSLKSGLKLQRCKKAKPIPQVSALYTEEEKAKMKAALEKDKKAARKMAEQAKKEISTLTKDQTATLYKAIGVATGLIDEWHTGTTQAVGDFKPKIVSNKDDISTALSGNLLWAATTWGAMPYKVILAFVGATVGTLGTIPSNYESVIGPVKGGLKKNLNNFRSTISNRLDVIIFASMKKYGFEKFEKLDFKEKRKLIWSWLFNIPWKDETIEAAKWAILNKLNSADKLASTWLEGYRLIWKQSVRSGGQDFTGPFYRFNQVEWSKHTSDPVEIYAGRRVGPFEKIRFPSHDPLLSDSAKNKRGASLLRLAIDQLLTY